MFLTAALFWASASTSTHNSQRHIQKKIKTFKVKLKSIWIEDEKVVFLKLLMFSKSVLFFETWRLHSYLPYYPTSENINIYMYVHTPIRTNLRLL